MANFAFDTFTDTAGTLLTAHTPDTGTAWIKHPSTPADTAVITTANRMRVAGDQHKCYYIDAEPPSADYYVEGVVYRADSAPESPGVLVRCDASAQTYYMLNINTGTNTLYLSRTNAGVSTVINSATVTPPSVGGSFTLKLSVIGDRLRGYINGVLHLDETDASITGAGYAGFRFYGAASGSETVGEHLDSFRAEAFNPFVYDSFTDTAGTALELHTPELGGPWVKHGDYLSGGAEISTTGTVFGSIAQTLSLFYLSASPSSADYDVEVEYERKSDVEDTAIVMGRMSTTQFDGYGFSYQANTSVWRLRKYVNGVGTDIDTVSDGTPTTGTWTLRLSMSGTQIRGYVDDVLVCEAVDSDVTAAGKAGILFYPAVGGSSNTSGGHFGSLLAADADAPEPGGGGGGLKYFRLGYVGGDDSGGGVTPPAIVAPNIAYVPPAEPCTNG